MKKLLFGLPVLAIMLSFAFCTKSEVQQLTETPNLGVVGDRANCSIAVFSDNIHAVTICGTNSNFNGCTSCTGAGVKGVEVLNGDGSAFTVNSPGEFYVTTAAPFGSFINLVGAVNQTGFVFIGGGLCKTYKLLDNCFIIPVP